MGIYSTNRSNVGVGFNSIPCAEGYADNDLGRILYESQCNDMAIFEAIVVNDLAEMNALREGTLLESEALKFSRRSISELIAGLKKRVAAFWAKIKAAFQACIRKISAYIFKDGKAFVEDFKKTMEKKTYTDGKVVAKKYPKKGTNVSDDVPDVSSVEDEIKKRKDDTDLIKSADVVKEFLGDTPSDFRKNRKETAFEENVSIGKSEIDYLLTLIGDASQSIKTLKKTENVYKNKLSKLEKVLVNAEKELAKADEDKENADTHKRIVKNITTLVSAYESLMSTCVASDIEIIKSNVKCARMVLAEVKSAAEKNGEVLHNSAAIEAGDEVETALNTPEEAIEPEVQEAIEQAEEAAEAEIATTDEV